LAGKHHWDAEPWAQYWEKRWCLDGGVQSDFRRVELQGDLADSEYRSRLLEEILTGLSKTKLRGEGFGLLLEDHWAAGRTGKIEVRVCVLARHGNGGTVAGSLR
jgi:hypothetical protein